MENKGKHGRKKQTKFDFTINREVLGILLAAFAVFLAAGLAGLNIGSLGAYLLKVLVYALGVGSFLFPLYVGVMGLAFIINHEHLRFSRKFFTLLLFLISILSLWHVYHTPEGSELIPEYLMTGGGLLGGAFFLLSIVKSSF